MKHKAADELSWRSKIERESEDDENINDFIDMQLNAVTVLALTAENFSKEILNFKYSSEHQQITYYLTTLHRSSEITSSNFQ